MKRMPARPDIGQLKKQAKDLLALYRSQQPDEALQRFREALPAAKGKTDAEIATMGLRLHDAQSSVAREHGFNSWAHLQSFVFTRRAQADDPAQAVLHWLRLVYAGDVAGGNNRSRPAVALRLLQEQPALLGDDPYLACAIGDETALRRATAQDPAWVHQPGGLLGLPPLVAVTHSGLMKLPGFAERLRACAKLLLDAGASPDQSIGTRWPPASLSKPDEAERLSALYGAAGQGRDPELTSLLLGAGADPNDGESLYHSLEQPACTHLLLQAGARGDETAARAIQTRQPGLIDSLSPAQLRLLPELAAQGCGDAVRVMVRLGWPIEVRGGDWDASALNKSVFRGDAALARFLLEHGADWQALHGFGDNACGSLSWGSLNEPVEGGDWVGCAQAMLDHGMPPARPDPDHPDGVLIGDRHRLFSDEVTDLLLGASPMDMPEAR